MSYVVSVCGGSGSGKSTFTGRLLEILGEDAAFIAHDDYYKHTPGMSPEQRAAYNFDVPAALDTHLLVEHVAQLRAGRPAQVPIYDFCTQTRCEHARTVEPVPVVVVEGILVMADDELMEQVDLSIFIDVDEPTRLERRLRRDCGERGWSLENAQRNYEQIVKPAHMLYVEPARAKADIVLNDALDDAALQVLAAGIRAAAEN
ncbi:MAG: uridine kinase [Coriobacteriales bacterium]|nr:uridine kinase [Coriobacteriaceae bacterium]MDD6768952.1 uridine kinase [Coriobacteriaceae bacterium]